MTISGNLFMRRCLIDNISVRGHSHILKDRECQDNSLCWDGGNYCAVIVCDGHGGEKYIRSSQGSDIACRKGKECIEMFMRCPDFTENGLRQLELSIIQIWSEEVLSDITCSPLEQDVLWESLSDDDKKSLLKNPTKAYGSTFIAAMYLSNRCFIVKLGDGDVNILYSDGTIEIPGELTDEQLQFNFTSSLCSRDADLSFKHCIKVGKKGQLVVGVIL